MLVWPLLIRACVLVESRECSLSEEALKRNALNLSHSREAEESAHQERQAPL